jgi:hypothetical protein
MFPKKKMRALRWMMKMKMKMKMANSSWMRMRDNSGGGGVFAIPKMISKAIPKTNHKRGLQTSLCEMWDQNPMSPTNVNIRDV